MNQPVSALKYKKWEGLLEKFWLNEEVDFVLHWQNFFENSCRSRIDVQRGRFKKRGTDSRRHHRQPASKLNVEYFNHFTFPSDGPSSLKPPDFDKNCNFTSQNTGVAGQ